MKKLFIIIVILFLTGCYDYNELTDLAIVSSMIVDYKEDEYVVNIEILETKKESSKTSFFLEGRGDNFEEALMDLYSKTPKHIYFNHIFAVVLSKSIALDKLENIYDFFLIDNDVRKDSVFVIMEETDKLLEFETEDKMSIGETIKNIFNYSEIENGKYKTVNFREILNSYLNKKNYYLTSIRIDKNFISLSDVYLVNNNKLSIKVDSDYVLFANILDNKVSSFMISLNDDTYEIYKYKSKIDFFKNKVSINLKTEVKLFGKINSSISSKENMDIIRQQIKNYLNTYIMKSIDYAYYNDKDLYNIDYLYYQYFPDKTRKGVFKDLDYDISVDVVFNEKGLMMEKVGDGKNE